MATPDAMAPALAGCDVAIMCADTASVAGFESLNEACLTLGIPWMRAALDHHRGVVGPTVIPHETACFTCLTLRMRGNAAAVEDAMAFERHLREGGTATESAVLAPFAGLVAQHASLEIVKLLTGFAHPATAGALLALDAITGETTRREVLKLPRCPACGPGRDRPQMKIWDIATTTGRGEG